MTVDDKFCDERFNRLVTGIEQRDKNVADRFRDIDKALQISSDIMERRLQGLNELRADVIKDRDLLVKKEAYDIKVAQYDEYGNRLTALETKIVTWGSAIVLVFAVVQLIVIWWK